MIYKEKGKESVRDSVLNGKSMKGMVSLKSGQESLGEGVGRVSWSRKGAQAVFGAWIEQRRGSWICGGNLWGGVLVKSVVGHNKKANWF